MTNYVVNLDRKKMELDIPSPESAIDVIFNYLENKIRWEIKKDAIGYQETDEPKFQIVAEISHNNGIIDRRVNRSGALMLLRTENEVYLKAQQTFVYSKPIVIASGNAVTSSLDDYLEQEEAKSLAYYDHTRKENDKKVKQVHSASEVISKYYPDLASRTMNKNQTPNQILIEAQARIFAYLVGQYLNRTPLSFEEIDQELKLAKGTTWQLLFGLKPIPPTRAMIDGFARILKVQPSNLFYDVAANYSSWMKCIMPPAPLKVPKREDFVLDLMALDGSD